LDEIEQRAVRFFSDQTDPETGLTRDRAPSDGSPSRAPASIAASGFALTAWCIGVDRGWLDREAVTQSALTLLRFVDRSVAQEHGWIYHFINIHTGARTWRSEASTIDTTLFLQGALLAREYLDNPEVSALVNEIYARIDWNWALNGGRTLSHGWKPETGFLADRWDSYSELLGLYLLGIGAPANSLPADSWRAWRRGPVEVYGVHTFISSPALFTHQYSHAWFDFRGQHDQYVDYWENSVDATLAQREWCATLSTRFNRWSGGLWGLTARRTARGVMSIGGGRRIPPTGWTARWSLAPRAVRCRLPRRNVCGPCARCWRSEESGYGAGTVLPTPSIRRLAGSRPTSSRSTWASPWRWRKTCAAGSVGSTSCAPPKRGARLP